MEVEVAKIWLVKSSGYILGPFSLEEVIQLLTTKHLSLIDEIRSPESRWTFIREHKMLSHVVQFVRDQQNQNKEDTGSTQVIKIPPPTPSIPTSQISSPPNQGSVSDVLAGPEGSRSVSHSDELPQYDSQGAYAESQLGSGQNSDEGRSGKANRPQIYPQIPELQKAPKNFRTQLIPVVAAVGLLIVGAASFVFYRSQTVPTPAQPVVKKVEVNPADVFARYEKAYTSKDFERAYSELMAYEKLQVLKPREVLRKLQIMAILMNQTSNASQILSGINLSIFDEEMKLEFQNLQGLIKLQDQQFADAKNIFLEIEKQDSAYEPAQINYMSALLAEGHYSEVNDEFRKMMLAGVKEPSIFVMRAMAVLLGSPEKHKMDSVIQDLQKFVGRYAEYQNEALLLLTGLQARAGMYRDANASVAKLVKNDPDATRKHFGSFAVSRRVSNWNQMSSICEATIKLLQDGATQKLLDGYCKYQLEDLQGALTVFEKGRIQYNREPAFLGLQAFILFKTKRLAELEAFISANSTASSELLRLVSGWNFLNKNDLGGAGREFKNVLGEIPQNLPALAGLAEIEIRSKNKEKANSYLTQLLTISENYLPLQDLRNQLDAL